MPYGGAVRPPRRAATAVLCAALAIPLVTLSVSGVKAAPPQSGPYVRDAFAPAGGTGSVLDVATLDDDSVFVATSLSDGTGVLDILDNPGDNNPPIDDSLTFVSGVLGVAANQIDDTAYLVSNSLSAPPGVVWLSQASAADDSWTSVTWGGSTGQEKFVAVSSTGTTHQVMTSADGIGWTLQADLSGGQSWKSVTWGDDTFVAVGGSGALMTSSDGVTWTARTFGNSSVRDFNSVAWSSTLQRFVAVSNALANTNSAFQYSTDGVTWTARMSPDFSNWSSVTWGGPTGQEKFVTVNSSTFGVRTLAYSADGITWTDPSTPSLPSRSWSSVTWGGPTGNQKFVAVTPAGNQVATSPDGINWTAGTPAADNAWSSVTWGGAAGQERFVAVATGGQVMTSPDGSTWTLQASAASNSWRSVCWGGGTFTAVSSTGIGNRVMTSGTAPPPAGGRAALWSYARGAVDDSAPLPGTGVGGAWVDIAVNDADDTVYVASQDDTRIIAFRGSNLDDSRSIPLPSGTTPYALAVNQTDDTVYVLSYGAGFDSYVTAMRGSNPDDSTTVTLTMVPGRQALAINPVDDTVYVGGWATLGKVEAYAPNLAFGDATVVGFGISVSGLAVSDDGRRLYATADNGFAYLYNTADFADTASVTLGVAAPGAVAVDDYGWAWTGNPSTSTGTRSLVQIGTAPTFTSITPASGSPSGGLTATITGSWFTPTTTAAFDVEANVATTIGTPTSNSMTVTVPPGPVGAADLLLTNVAGPSQPLGVNASGTFTYADPSPPVTPSAPGSVTATAGDASATITWTAPTSLGSFPVTNYQVTSSPGGQTCLTSTLTCTVTGLKNGTTYTFTVKALSGAGWGESSTPSNAVTPTAPPTPTITITGSRDGQRITVTGTPMHLTSQTVRPWLRFPGETTYSEGAAVIPISANGSFTWSRKTGKKTYVYVAHGTTRSNTVTIPAR